MTNCPFTGLQHLFECEECEDWRTWVYKGLTRKSENPAIYSVDQSVIVMSKKLPHGQGVIATAVR
jgi:hypothetical protein